jgi:hypothetical protein
MADFVWCREFRQVAGMFSWLVFGVGLNSRKFRRVTVAPRQRGLSFPGLAAVQ